MRFYALRLREAGMVKSNPNKIVADGTDWRFLNELKRELRGAMLAVFLVTLVMLLTPILVQAHDAAHHISQAQRLPEIAPAPGFALTSQDGTLVTLEDFRGKVVAVTFIYTSCVDSCPVLTAMMVYVEDLLGHDFGAKVVFVSITVDPGRDTPELLKQYAHTFGANLAGWSFLTGTSSVIKEVTRRYGVFASKMANVVRFDREEFRRDLLSLLQEH
jgi:protein SCO1/2